MLNFTFFNFYSGWSFVNVLPLDKNLLLCASNGQLYGVKSTNGEVLWQDHLKGFGHTYITLTNGKVTDFIFPREFYYTHRNSFSRDHNGQQLKFNIELRGARYTMKIPGMNDTYINEYIGAVNNL